MEFLFLYILTGIIAGLFAGLLGVGGGLIVVPALALIFAMSKMPHELLMHMAAGTSLAVMIFTAMSSSYAHNRNGNVNWSVFWRLLPAILCGVIAGVICSSFLHNRALEILFGLFVLFVSYKMFFGFKPKPARKLPELPLLSSVGFLIGAKSGLLGVGGGAITIPFLSYCNVPLRKASGTSAICTLPIAIVGSIGFLITGWNNSLPYSLGYIYWPAFLCVAAMTVICAPIGAKIAKHTNVEILRKIFAVFMVLVGLKLLF